MIDFLKGIFMFVSVVIAACMFAAVTATLSFVKGWTSGVLHLLNDANVSTPAELINNSTAIYFGFVILFFILVFITVKVMEKIGADFLWLVAIVVLAGVLAGPYFYTYYYHGGLALTV